MKMLQHANVLCANTESKVYSQLDYAKCMKKGKAQIDQNSAASDSQAILQNLYCKKSFTFSW